MNQTTMTPTHLLSNYEPFRAWLLSQPSDALVGTANNPLDCPLQNYLLTLLPAGTVPSVGASTYGWYDACTQSTINFLLERWARLFVYYLDMKYGERAVAAWQALDMLDAAIAQAEPQHTTFPVDWVALLQEQKTTCFPTIDLEVKELVTA